MKIHGSSLLSSSLILQTLNSASLIGLYGRGAGCVCVVSGGGVVVGKVPRTAPLPIRELKARFLFLDDEQLSRSSRGQRVKAL